MLLVRRCYGLPPHALVGPFEHPTGAGMLQRRPQHRGTPQSQASHVHPVAPCEPTAEFSQFPKRARDLPLVIQRYGRVWGWFNAGDLVLTILVTLVAEFVALRIGLAYFQLPAWVAVLFGLLLVALSMSGHRYWRWERIALGLAAFNGLFLVAAILAGPNWAATGKAFGTLSPLPGGSFTGRSLLCRRPRPQAR